MNMRYGTIITLFFIAQLIAFTKTLRVSCKTETNEDVDWYYMYKLPKHYSNAIENDESGLRYTYITSNQNLEGWQISNITINETESFPGRTLGSLLNDPDILVISYNDEVPNGPTDDKNGHTKGVVATDGTHAIWLIHSVPKFPNFSVYTYPKTGEHFGQSFLCITFNATTEMNLIADQLLFNEPNVYFSHIPSRLADRYPILEQIILKRWRSEFPFHKLVELTSVNGTKFTSFAKGRKFGLELYKDWVAPSLDTDLLVETWRNSAGKLPSNCSDGRKVYNVDVIDENQIDVAFKSSTDHSKWAVAYEEGNHWICVGDINRDRHQLVRGGGTICQNNPMIAKLYRDSVKQFEKCGMWDNYSCKKP